MAATTKHEVLFRMRDSGNLIGVLVWVFYWWGFCVLPFNVFFEYEVEDYSCWDDYEVFH